MRALAAVVLFSFACASAAPPFESGAKGFVLTADQALASMAKGARVLDVRPEAAFAAGHAPNAVRIDWKDFSEPNDPERGKLLSDDRVLGFYLERAGIRADRPVIVVGDPLEGWGEDGRIVWMLRTLGHSQAAFVDGGHAALVEKGLLPTAAVSTPEAGKFEVKRTNAYSIDLEGLANVIGSPDGTVIIDGREPREFRGETPYGEKRGGHVPGARSLYFKDLMDPRGRLLPSEALWAKLGAVGVTRQSRVVAYCTGGVRSGWLSLVLLELGVPSARNFAGSMWEWSAQSADRFPLVTGD